MEGKAREIKADSVILSDGNGVSTQIASLLWGATCLHKLESPQGRARIAADWILDPFIDPSVTQIRDR